MTLDEHRAAAVAAGVLEIADPSWDVAGIHVAQAVRLTDLRRSQQHLGRRVLRVVHPVVLVERGDVPRYVG